MVKFIKLFPTSIQRHPRKRIFWLAFLFLTIIMVLHVHGEKDVQKIESMVNKTIDLSQKTQTIKDEWEEEKAKLKLRYQSLNEEKARLEKEKEHLKKFLEVKEKEVHELEYKAKEVVHVKKELHSYLDSVITELEAFINRDPAFLPEERSQRLTSIKETLSQSNTSAAEKFRRVMEALQVETGYGRTVEVYQDAILLDEKSVNVDILRVGRLSLFFRTPDGSMVGHYHRADKKWKPLSNQYRHEINDAMEIASKQRTVDIVRLPIGRIVVP